MREDEIWIQVTYPEAAEDGTADPTRLWAPRYRAAYEEIAGDHHALLNYEPVYKTAVDRGAQDDWKAGIEIHYFVADDGPV